MPNRDAWLTVAAEELGVAELTAHEVKALLDLARDVAHSTERRYAPLTCFLLGLAAAKDRSQVAATAATLAVKATSPS